MKKLLIGFGILDGLIGLYLLISAIYGFVNPGYICWNCDDEISKFARESYLRHNLLIVAISLYFITSAYSFIRQRKWSFYLYYYFGIPLRICFFIIAYGLIFLGVSAKWITSEGLFLRKIIIIAIFTLVIFRLFITIWQHRKLAKQKCFT